MKTRTPFGPTLAALLLVLLCPTLITIPAKASTTNTITLISDTNDLCWTGVTSSDLVTGYIVPPSSASWSNAVPVNWGIVPGVWNPQLIPASYKNILFSAPAANWIWNINPLPDGETYTGGIVFFEKSFTIPVGASILSANLYITTDNGLYAYLSNPSWSGTTNLLHYPEPTD